MFFQKDRIPGFTLKIFQKRLLSMLEKQKAREPYHGDLHIIGNSFLKDLL